MMSRPEDLSDKAARRLRVLIAKGGQPPDGSSALVQMLLGDDLIVRDSGGDIALTGSGRARLRRQHAQSRGDIDAFRAQHLSLATRELGSDDGVAARVTIDDAESPLAWFARRKGRDGRALIDPTQFLAGERLRADFTRANMMPRTTSSWDASAARGTGGGGGGGEMTDLIVASRQRVSRALDACGPEFSGLLMDVCCFLRKLEDIERERGWPVRSAKVVLQLALDRLARHYGLRAQATGRASGMRRWVAEG